MVIVIIFTALLVLNAYLFLRARRRNREIAHERQCAALKAYVRSHQDTWTEADGR